MRGFAIEVRMFTGIVEEIGRIKAVRPEQNGITLDIGAAQVVEGLRVGASIAVDGVCQTVLQVGAAGFVVAAEMETLRATTLGRLRPGERVNLERSVALGGRLDGHLVLGHVDGRGRLVARRREERTHVLEIELPEALRPYVAPKGCIAVDGVSLTVGSRVQAGRFEVFLIPHTWERTTLSERHTGDDVNVEVDVIARYVRHLMGQSPDAAQEGLRWETLARALGGGGGP